MLATRKKVTRKQTKTHNKHLVLKTIYDEGAISRASVARATHLTRPTVSSTVAELIEAGLIAEVGQGPSQGGKPPILLSVVDDSRHLIGIDLANSEFRGAVLDLRGTILHRFSLPVADHNGDAALNLVYQLIDQLVAASTRPILGIGMGTPGLMDARQGIVRQAVNLDWQDLPLRDLLSKRYDVPVYIANDSHVAALGEYTFGAGREMANLIVLKVGRGVSAGIVLNSQLHYGDGSGAGEIGHVVVVENGERCLCGQQGCLETVTSSRAIIEQAKTLARKNPHSALHHFVTSPEAITTNTVLQAVEAGDADLQRVIVEVGRYLGIAVANLVGILNIQHILIAGSVARFGEDLLEPLRQEMGRRAMTILVNETHVGLSSLGQDIVLQGAAALLLSHELGLV